jgi:hypothetical protein
MPDRRLPEMMATRKAKKQADRLPRPVEVPSGGRVRRCAEQFMLHHLPDDVKAGLGELRGSETGGGCRVDLTGAAGSSAPHPVRHRMHAYVESCRR